MADCGSRSSRDASAVGRWRPGKSAARLVASGAAALLFTCAAFAAAPSPSGPTVIRTIFKESEADQRGDYKTRLLLSILQATERDWGPYVLKASEPLSRKRALRELISGRLINLYTAPADAEWEKSVLPIRVPIRRGLLNYRLLLVTTDSLPRFAGIRTVEQLKRRQVGLRQQWTTAKIMHALGFAAVYGVSYESIFKMLSKGRFDYIPRGVNEIFGELEARKQELPNLAIEPSLALYMPLPVYFYVSPTQPELAGRIRAGFHAIRENGVFGALFNEFFGEQISQAQLDKRHIIRLGNPLLSRETPLQQKELWFYQVE